MQFKYMTYCTLISIFYGLPESLTGLNMAPVLPCTGSNPFQAFLFLLLE